MAYRKAKQAPKQYLSDKAKIRSLVLETMKDISDLVGATMGPGGKVVLLESDHVDISDRCSKDGISVFQTMQHHNSFKDTIINVARTCSLRSANVAGDGTTTTSVLANEIIRNIFDFCEKNPKQSPQKTVRRIEKVVEKLVLPYIESRSIKVTEENKELLFNVAKISANGETELAKAVIECFELVGYGESSHCTIKEESGPSSYRTELLEGYPMPIGLEESAGKYFQSFINDQGSQRCYLENPKFILFDGSLQDLMGLGSLFNSIESRIQNDPSQAKEFKNIVLVAHGFSEQVINTLSFNFEQTGTLRIVPLRSPMSQFMNGQTHWMMDLAAFSGAKIFGLKNRIDDAIIEDLGMGMTSFEANRFRSTLSGNPDPVNVEYRADEIKKQLKSPESKAEAMWLEERVAKLTSGIAKLTVIGSNSASVKERCDRVDDAFCSVRSSIVHGILPGGCRIAIDLSQKLSQELEENDPARVVLVPSFLALFNRLLDNAGYHEDDSRDILQKLIENDDKVYDIENQEFGEPTALGIFDASKAVSEAIRNSVEIASVLGTLGGIVVHPRDDEYERSEARLDDEWKKVSQNPDAYQNPALNRARG